jgi:hypothetical protein
MVVRGHVQNGVVVLDNGVRLPEGQEVAVVAQEPRAAPVTQDRPPHRVLDIAPVSLGAVLSTPSPDDDRLGEMLEGRT